MSAFLLTWKEEEWDYKNVQSLVDTFARDGFVECLWRVFATRQAKAGDKAFLLKQLPNPRGIFAAGILLDAPIERHDPTDTGVIRPRSHVRWELFVDPMRGEFLVPHSMLRNFLSEQRINAQASGNSRLTDKEENELSLYVAQSDAARSLATTQPDTAARSTTGLAPTSWIRTVQRDAGQPAVTYILQYGTRNVWKVGHTENTRNRLNDINKHIPFEVTNERWELSWTQNWPTSQHAFEMEQAILKILSDKRSSAERVICSRDEILTGWTTALQSTRLSS